MMNLPRSCLLAALLGLATHSASAASQKSDLNDWFNRQLTPFVQQQLSTHPRFKGESIRFVTMQNGTPQATSSALALKLRDRLQASAADVEGITIAWHSNDPSLARNMTSSGIDCTKGEAHYLIGIEVALDQFGELTVNVRALDLEDQVWVSGMHKTWQGRITAQQRREYHKAKSDRSFQGERSAPYSNVQTDLLAAHLARNLACTLLQQTKGEYVVTAAKAEPKADSSDTMLELVSNNLGEFQALRFSAKTDDANAVIEGKAHRIDNDLFQYWITVRPSDATSQLPTLSASAYILLPDEFASATAQADEAKPEPVLQTRASYLHALKIVEAKNASACRSGDLRASSTRVYRRSRINPMRDCYSLQVESSDDAVVFFLNHQLNNGLVRLSDTACVQRASARIARSHEPVHFSLPRDALPSSSWSTVDTWRMTPDTDTYYAVAARETKAARALSQHIAALPKRCSASVRPGVEGTELQHWMMDLAKIVDQWAPSIDWQIIRVKNRY